MTNTSINTLTTLAAPAGRVLISAVFLLAGINKIPNYEGTQGYMDAMGVPGALLPLVIAFEILAPIAVIIGFKTRIAAFALAGFSVLTAISFHNNFGDQAQMMNFMKNIAIAGGFLSIVAHGAGAFSLDARAAAK